MKKRGFTLVELLAVIAVLSIIVGISIFAYSAVIKNTKQKIKETEVLQLKNAANAYYRELESSEHYLSYTKEGITYSCISIKALKDMGYYSGDLSFYNELLTDENAVVKVKKENGIASYEVITDYDGDKDCIYDDFTGNLSDANINVDNGDEENKVTVNTDITTVAGSKNTYDLKLHLEADVFEKIEIHEGTTGPVYISFVVDESGSMGYTDNQLATRWDKVKTAAINMTNSLSSNFGDNLYLELIKFSNGSAYVRKFTDVNHSVPFSDSELVHNRKNNGTYVANGLHRAYSSLLDDTVSSEDKNRKFVILLTDGEYSDVSCQSDFQSLDNYNNYTNSIVNFCTNCNTIEGCSNEIKEKASLFIIAYEMSATNKELYKKYASVDANLCGNSDDGSTCYYNSTFTDTDSLFKSLSSIIEKTVKTQTISKATVVMKFADYVNAKDSKGNLVSDLNIDIDFNDEDYEEEVVNKIYQYKLQIDESKLTSLCDYSGANKECTYTGTLFSEYYANLYDMSGNFLEKLELGNSPQVTITKAQKSYINGR